MEHFQLHFITIMQQLRPIQTCILRWQGGSIGTGWTKKTKSLSVSPRTKFNTHIRINRIWGLKAQQREQIILEAYLCNMEPCFQTVKGTFALSWTSEMKVVERDCSIVFFNEPRLTTWWGWRRNVVFLSYLHNLNEWLATHNYKWFQNIAILCFVKLLAHNFFQFQPKLDFQFSH